MFDNLRETIRGLNADVKNVANCQRARKLKSTLLLIGLPLAIIGFGGVFVCFALFATAGFDAFGPNGFTPRILVPFLLFIPCGVVGAIGARLASLGFKIVVTGYTTNLIDEVVGNNCPHCGAEYSAASRFCPKCGRQVRKECPHCQHINSHKNAYCEKCGHKLD